MTILVPYWIVELVLIIIQVVGKKIHFNIKYVLTFLGIDMISGLWFVTALLIFYLLFFIVFNISKHLNLKPSYPIFTIYILVFVYCLTCYIYDIDSYYTASASAFLLGITWHHISDNFVAFIRKNYMVCAISISLLFFVAFFGRLILAAVGFENIAIHMILRNIISVLFVLTVITIIQKIHIKSRILYWFGQMSYEIYLTHFVAFQIVEIFHFINLCYILFAFACIPLSVLLKKLSKKIISSFLLN